MLLQSQVRGLLARRRYQRLQRLAVGLQARARGLWARRRYQLRRQERAVSGERGGGTGERNIFKFI